MKKIKLVEEIENGREDLQWVGKKESNLSYKV